MVIRPHNSKNARKKKGLYKRGESPSKLKVFLIIIRAAECIGVCYIYIFTVFKNWKNSSIYYTYLFSTFPPNFEKIEKLFDEAFWFNANSMTSKFFTFIRY